MFNPMASSFLRAYRALEVERDLQPLMELFSPACVLHNSALAGSFKGIPGARRFLRMYLDNFQRVQTDFRNVVSDEHHIALEWRSTGFTVDGNMFDVCGVTMIELDAGLIVRLTAYFDPTVLDGAFASEPAA